MPVYRLENLTCADCAANLERRLRRAPGVHEVHLNFATGVLNVRMDEPARLPALVAAAAPDVRLQPLHSPPDEAPENPWKTLTPWLVSAVLFVLGLLFRQESFPVGEVLAFGGAYLICGGPVLRRAGRDLLHGALFDEQFLMSVATLGAWLIGEWPEAVGVMLFYQLGEFFQGLAVGRARRSVRALLAQQPERAWRCLPDGAVEAVHPASVAVGEEVLVRPGDRVPLDGRVLSGESWLDTSALTGESLPRAVGPGDAVAAGMVNGAGALRVRVTRPYDQSTLARMLALVEQSAERKARTEQAITRFARVYSPLMVALAAGLAVVPPLLGGGAFSLWVHRALVLLVISCPCALVISIPLGYFGGVGGASRRGVLVKGAHFLDVLAEVRTVVFDKTGTLTRGEFQVAEVVPAQGWSVERLLAVAAQAEQYASHPLARSVRAAFVGPVRPNGTPRVQEIPGHGVRFQDDEMEVLAGNDALMHREAVAHEVCRPEGTAVHVAVNGQYAGHLRLMDGLRPDAAAAIADLRAVGVRRVWMLTGDNEGVAAQVAQALGVDTYRAELLPEDKVRVVERLLAEGPGPLAFVGDGVNDAPALARADVGIAMGGLGAQAAIEAADVVVLGDSPARVAEVIRVARKTRAVVRQNIALALTVKVAVVVLGALGLASMGAAVFADVGVALLAVANASRVLR